MEIIKKGNSHIVKEITCPVCESLLRYTHDDIIIKQEMFMGALRDNTYIHCPVCGYMLLADEFYEFMDIKID